VPIAIIILLAAIALYCAVNWVRVCLFDLKHRGALDLETIAMLDRSAFHNGLCVILCVGFIGLITHV